MCKFKPKSIYAHLMLCPWAMLLILLVLSDNRTIVDLILCNFFQCRNVFLLIHQWSISVMATDQEIQVAGIPLTEITHDFMCEISGESLFLEHFTWHFICEHVFLEHFICIQMTFHMLKRVFGTSCASEISHLKQFANVFLEHHMRSCFQMCLHVVMCSSMLSHIALHIVTLSH